MLDSVVAKKSILKKHFGTFLSEQDGATSVEYAVAMGAIFLAVIATIVVVGISLNSSFVESEAEINSFFTSP